MNLPTQENALKSTEELIRIALTEEDEKAAWEAIMVLHCRGNQEVFEAAIQLCNSKRAKERKLGVDILAQLGIPERTFYNECLGMLLQWLENEEDMEVLQAIAIGLGHIGDQAAIAPLVKLKNHPNSGVRFGVVFGLLGYEDELAISTLIEFSSDEDEKVRDWATFGLGSQIYTDTPEIREALFQRLTDEDDDTRGEAFVGLARRKDNRVIDPLMKELLYPHPGSLLLEAGEEIGIPYITEKRDR